MKRSPSPNIYDGTTEEESTLAQDGDEGLDPAAPSETDTASLPKLEPVTPKGKFLTKTFGVINRNIKWGTTKDNKKHRTYKCLKCSLSFPKLAEENAHYKLKHEPVSCDICGQSFNTPSTLHHHKYIHAELKFKCSVCNKGFPFTSDRDVHLVKHEPNHKHKCDSCERAFFMKGDLEKHMLTHLNKAWKCSMCKYVTKDQCNLKAHMRLHSKLMLYLCENCLKLL